ncbi:spermidine/putrescine transport system ATP-binding protein [Tistlia consotensis]|uniref:Spermidine/putrescine import ATP-binding protein PotA n=1 Tax=Tistlia consotensis USBA 355 TaxID=560819 RepID=A0A1Y6BA14_9PROT|nr:ABC transporter ATP-binding protein [Tistlia consotensis]SME89537.1 spermidine/putrescine transport system ATP-binding protein [Tistlia consotensis USBA 355]SNR26053.1 spermidine/putrescine transport system ATP-binding protein [Tistlia consotensis]
MAVSAVEAQGVTKVFGSGAGEVRALDEVDVAIRQNEFFTLLGPSGCGKTTLLRLIAGFEQPTSGEILLEGQPIAGTPPFRRPVNTVFQSYALFPHMSVAQNVGFGMEMLGKDRRTIAETVERTLDLVKLGGLAGRKPAQLSGGQQQRVALARALANRPKVLLLDEPLSALDLKLRKEMQIELKRLQGETGITFVFVTHDQEEALTMSDRIAVMSAGRILQVGSPTEIYEKPTRRFVADFIGETNFLAAEVVAGEAGSLRVRLPGGRELSVLDAFEHKPGQTVTLAVRPERAELAEGGAEAQLAGRVENLVYFGTDTTYHVGLEAGGGFVVRLQNREGARRRHEVGASVGIRLPAEAVQVLRD